MNEAELLFCDLLECDRPHLYMQRGRKLSDEERRRIASCLKRRMQGEPVQYILGRSHFYGREFRVTPDVLIPRPETELLAERCLEEAGNEFAHLKTVRILDIGTGSGCIAVTLAAEDRRMHVTALDVSPAALSVAKDNALRHGVERRVTFLQTDFLTQEPSLGMFDIVVSNPPYIREDEIAGLAPEVQREPRLALSAGSDGLVFYRRICQRLGEILAPGGVLLLEVGMGQADAVRSLLQIHNISALFVQNDYNGIARVVCAKSKVDHG